MAARGLLTSRRGPIHLKPRWPGGRCASRCFIRSRSLPPCRTLACGAERWRDLVDDAAAAIAHNGDAHANLHDPLGIVSRLTGRRACRHRRPPTLDSAHTRMDAARRHFARPPDADDTSTPWLLVAHNFSLGLSTTMHTPACHARYTQIVAAFGVSSGGGLDSISMDMARHRSHSWWFDRSRCRCGIGILHTRLWPIMLHVKGHGSRDREPLEEIACTLPLE